MWRILNTLVLAGQTGHLGLLGSRGGAFYEPYILSRYPESITNSTEFVTGTFIYIKLVYFQNLMKNECNMRCLRD